MMYLDLKELPTLFTPYRAWSLERPNIASFQRRDYLGDKTLPLETAVRDLVKKRTGHRPSGPIRILTHLRYFGYCFNPVSFYYCFNDNDTSVETIITEINNTPWLERHQYVLDKSLNKHPNRKWRRYRFKKEFHISPFMDMQISYDWRFLLPEERLSVHLNNFQKGAKLFDATLTLSRREITLRNLTNMLLKYPLMTAKVTAMIYWQALRLHRKGTPFFAHPSGSAVMTKRAIR